MINKSVRIRKIDKIIVAYEFARIRKIAKITAAYEFARICKLTKLRPLNGKCLQTHYCHGHCGIFR